MAAITRIKIHPGIGVARLGDHPTATFDGPQKPFDSKVPSGGYKKDGMIKRQAAVFRLFAYDINDKLVGELSAADADIRWHVELANKKAFGAKFNGLDSDPPLRNPNVPDSQRHRLAIQPTGKFVDLTNRNAKFDDGKFTSWKRNGTSPKNVNNIFLGELRADSKGVLRVLGAKGRSESPHNIKIEDYANNDSWFDDVADGPVNATITLNDTGETFEAETAWVICAPPSFAPQIRNVITLYDMLLDRAVDRGLFKVPARPSFALEVFPLLKAAFDVKWLQDLTGAHTFDGLLSANSTVGARNLITAMLRKPNGSGGKMPMLLNDEGGVGLSLTSLQHAILKKWAAGEVKTTGQHAGPPTPPTEVTPEGMDRAALEACAGGGFFPGIEAGWFLRDKYDLVDGDRFRLSIAQDDVQCPILKAGDITKQMALPWQADFTLCRKEEHGSDNYGWWPAVRPDDVFFGSSATTQKLWAGSIDDRSLTRSMQFETMLKKWKTFGFVVKSGTRYEVKT